MNGSFFMLMCLKTSLAEKTGYREMEKQEIEIQEKCRGGCRAAATSKMEGFVIIVNC